MDNVVAMGLRSAVVMCQRVTLGISSICAKAEFSYCNYLDDFVSAESQVKANEAVTYLHGTLNNARLVEVCDK